MKNADKIIDTMIDVFESKLKKLRDGCFPQTQINDKAYAIIRIDVREKSKIPWQNTSKVLNVILIPWNKRLAKTIPWKEVISLELHLDRERDLEYFKGLAEEVSLTTL